MANTDCCPTKELIVKEEILPENCPPKPDCIPITISEPTDVPGKCDSKLRLELATQDCPARYWGFVCDVGGANGSWQSFPYELEKCIKKVCSTPTEPPLDCELPFAYDECNDRYWLYLCETGWVEFNADTDTFGTVVQATENGTDTTGRQYSAGSYIIEFPDGTSWFNPVLTDGGSGIVETNPAGGWTIRPLFDECGNIIPVETTRLHTFGSYNPVFNRVFWGPTTELERASTTLAYPQSTPTSVERENGVMVVNNPYDCANIILSCWMGGRAHHDFDATDFANNDFEPYFGRERVYADGVLILEEVNGISSSATSRGYRETSYVPQVVVIPPLGSVSFDTEIAYDTENVNTPDVFIYNRPGIYSLGIPQYV